jgi:hypothetical protein
MFRELAGSAMTVLRHCAKVFLLLISVLDWEAWASGASRPAPAVAQTDTNGCSPLQTTPEKE